MGDDDIRELTFILKIDQEVDNLGLNRDVQRGDGFITDYDLGVEGQGTGDADALPLSAAEFVGIASIAGM